MTTGLRILAGILGLLGTLLVHNYPLAGFIFYVLTIAAFLLSLFAHRKEEQLKRKPLKIVFLDNKEVFRTKYEEDKPIEFQKMIMAIVSMPYFPPGLRNKIQSDGLDSFNLIDLEKKKIIAKYPKMMSGIKSTMIIFIYTNFMSDLPLEAKLEIALKTYFTD